MKNAISERMKSFYEQRSRTYLPRRTNTIIRLDGKAFGTYTKGLKRPFDEEFMQDMTETTKFLCKEIQGTKLGYTQSDEISILLTDYDDIGTHAWFDGQIQKIASVSASIATAKFNELRAKRGIEKLAMFDARVFTIPELEEVVNYFIWRQEDATRNSISMAAQTFFSHKQLHKKSTNQMQEMMMSEKNINWNHFSCSKKRGTLITKKQSLWLRDSIDKSKHTPLRLDKRKAVEDQSLIYERSSWEKTNTPIFTKDRRAILDEMPIPQMYLKDL